MPSIWIIPAWKKYYTSCPLYKTTEADNMVRRKTQHLGAFQLLYL